MNEVKPVLAYNDKISTFKKQLKIPNIGIVKFTCIKMNIKLNYNLVKNT